MLSANTFNCCALLLIAGFVSACGSGGDSALPVNTQETVEGDLLSSDGLANSEETGAEPGAVDVDPVQTGSVDSGNGDTGNGETGNGETGNGETGESATQNTNSDSAEASAETSLANPQNESEPEIIDSEQESTVAVNESVSFGSAKLLVDLVPGGSSYPARFHRTGDTLYFWTVDTDPLFARCAYHWGSLSDADKNVSFNLVATHPETGVVAMNRKIMTLGDFAEDPNYACAGFNGSIMQVYEPIWATGSATGEQKFVLHFDSFGLGPDRVWSTDGTEANTSLLETGQIEEQSIFAGDKVFFATSDGLSVSDTFSGDRRKLFESSEGWYPDIKQIVRSPARQATFEISVGPNRTQIWTYDLDTDEWAKKFSIKPDDNIYVHNQTLLVDGNNLLSLGRTVIDYESALGLSSTFGDVTSFEILSDSAPTIHGDNNDRLFYSTTDFSVEPQITTIWSYSEERIENLFSISVSGLLNRKVIAGHDGRIYVSGTRDLRQGPDINSSLELWSYDSQTGQLVKLSSGDWYSYLTGNPVTDEGYVFRYLSTADGLIFINLTEDSGRELWFTDGTREGTRQLADINPGTGNSDPQNFYYSGEAIYFSANDGMHGHEPWMVPVSR